MKKTVAMMLALMSLFALAACSDPEEGNVAEDRSLSEIMEEIQSGVELPALMEIPIDDENFPYYLFIEKVEGEALASEAMISAIPFSMALLRTAEGADAAKAAEEIRENADPRKWICVEAEQVEVTRRGNLILLVMADSATAGLLTENFNALS